MSVAEQRVTLQQYLEMERVAEFKSEYLNGQVFAMTGASRKHNLITGNLFALLHAHFATGSCEVYVNDMRVKTRPSGLYTYPALTVVCGQPEFEDGHLDTLVNPLVIFEVLSPSTETYDRGEKFRLYRDIQSLQEYFLVAQAEPRIERFVRQPDGTWTATAWHHLTDTARVESVDCALPLEAVYRRVEFAPA